MYKNQEEETCLSFILWELTDGTEVVGRKRKQRCGLKGETKKSDQRVKMGSTGRRSFVRWSQNREQKPRLAGCGDWER